MIGGFLPCSFIDYPGRLSAVVFLRGCNLRCPYCHNPRLIDRNAPRLMSEAELLSFLGSRRGRREGVVITGGEPTLHPGLRRLVEAVRACGFQVKLDTNGTRPEMLAELLKEPLVDYIAMDLKDEPHTYAEWLGMREAPETLLRSIEIIKASGIDHELCTTVVLPRHEEGRLDHMAAIAAGCRRWVLQPYRPGSGLQSHQLFSPPGESALETLASQLRAKHGVNCFCRSEQR
jgi:pyruvate formate lyase activating enzyme